MRKINSGNEIFFKFNLNESHIVKKENLTVEDIIFPYNQNNQENLW